MISFANLVREKSIKFGLTDGRYENFGRINRIERKGSKVSGIFEDQI